MRLLKVAASLALLSALAAIPIYAQRGGGGFRGGAPSGGGGFRGGAGVGGGGRFAGGGFRGAPAGGGFRGAPAGGGFRVTMGGFNGGGFRGGGIGFRSGGAGFRPGGVGFRSGGFGYRGFSYGGYRVYNPGFAAPRNYPRYSYGVGYWGYPYYGYSSLSYPIGGYSGPSYYGSYYDPYYYAPNNYAPTYVSAPAYTPPASPVIINQNYQPERVGAATISTPPQEAYYRAPDFYLIAFNNHTIHAAISYVVEGDTLRYTTREHEEKTVPLSSIDGRFTEQINRDRRVEFRLP